MVALKHVSVRSECERSKNRYLQVLSLVDLKQPNARSEYGGSKNSSVQDRNRVIRMLSVAQILWHWQLAKNQNGAFTEIRNSCADYFTMLANQKVCSITYGQSVYISM